MPAKIREKLEKEIQQLEHELSVELPRELKRAVALGDLSENAEYHMAKQRQEFVRARLGQLKKRLADLSLVNLNNIPRDRAAYGSTVKVRSLETDEEVEYRLVSSEESDVAKGLISTSSPIGRGLLGKKVGDTTRIQTPGGAKEFEVLQLTTIYEQEEGEDSPETSQV
jgi:transcription elongation factor GreA